MVIVVGGGPAGALYAYLMARRGHSVIVYDPGSGRRCGEAVPAPMLEWGLDLYEAWSRIVYRYVSRHVAARIRSVANVWTRGDRIHYSVGDVGDVVGYVIDKREMIDDILSRAESEGAAVVKRRLDPRNMLVDVVACSVCAAALRKPWRSAVVYQAYVEKSPILDIVGADAVIVFSPLIRGPGYAWAWPARGGYNVGVGWAGWSPGVGEAREILYRLKLAGGGIVDDGFSVIHWYRPMGHWRVKTLVPSRTFLGEAAGLVTPMAEGIRPAMLSAVAAAYNNEWLWRLLVDLAGTPMQRRLMFTVARLANKSHRAWRRLVRAAAGREALLATRPPRAGELLRMLAKPS